MKGYPAANRMLNKWGDKFKATFNISLGSFIGYCVIWDIQDFDIVKFDTYLQRLGYQIEKDGSISDYVRKHFGQKAVELIRDLIWNGEEKEKC